ncbi:sporulation protein [Paenisporosarcina cavernae]|uniref:Stage 0 sporulation protein M n=1 Tax=Paenisporosarcina cavernae TaxID=2320858 RepID=A0A385YRW0_9BACL|nr:sporulation protein [Paenisporosarcina cavernae]AYC29479.1 stage 0 sporulation protein M [Paenisporosarcina cavernae]
MLKKFLSTIGIGTMKVDTILDKRELTFDENLSGTIYIDGGDSEQMIEYVKLEVIKRVEGHREDSDFDVTDQLISKHSIELVGSLKSKETRMIPFEMQPDDRWSIQDNEKLLLRTTIHIANAVDVYDEDEILYGEAE